MIESNKHIHLIALSILIVSTFINCDSSLDPLEKRDGAFSIFATINMDSPIKYFRIDDLNKTLFDERTSEFDGVATIKNLDTGISKILPDSIISFDGIYTHNFYSRDIQYDTKYQLTVTRISDGSTTTGTWTTPARAKMTIDAGPIEKRNCYSPIKISFSPVSEVNEIEFRILLMDPESRHSLNLEFQKGENRTVYTKVTAQLIAKRAFGSFSEECRRFNQSGKNFLITFTHYGPNYFENNNAGRVEDPILVNYFGAQYNDSTIFRFNSDE